MQARWASVFTFACLAALGTPQTAMATTGAAPAGCDCSAAFLRFTRSLR